MLDAADLFGHKHFSSSKRHHDPRPSFLPGSMNPELLLIILSLLVPYVIFLRLPLIIRDWLTVTRTESVSHTAVASSCFIRTLIIISRLWVIIDRVWIGNWIYWTLTDPWLQVIITFSLIHTLYTSLEHTIKSSQPAVSSPVVVW
jgi:hypothetical protein